MIDFLNIKFPETHIANDDKIFHDFARINMYEYQEFQVEVVMKKAIKNHNDTVRNSSQQKRKLELQKSIRCKSYMCTNTGSPECINFKCAQCCKSLACRRHR